MEINSLGLIIDSFLKFEFYLKTKGNKRNLLGGGNTAIKGKNVERFCADPSFKILANRNEASSLVGIGFSMISELALLWSKYRSTAKQIWK